MAGTIIADKIQTENAFLTLNVGQTLVATINSSGILNSSGGTMIGANGSVSNTAITGLVTASQIATVANTQLTGLIQAAQIGSANATLITSGTLPGARLPTGSVLQVVQGSITATATTISTSYVTSGLSLSITPSSASNKVLVFFSGPTYCANITGNYGAIAIFNGSNNLISGFAGSPGQSGGYCNSSLVYLDSPATTSAVTYAIYIKSEGASSTAGIGWTTVVNTGARATITAMEISA